MKKKILAVFLSLCMAMSLLPVTALAAEGEETISSPTASGNNFFANGTPITITAEEPDNGVEKAFDNFTAKGEDAYISWTEDGVTKYVGVDGEKDDEDDTTYVSIYGGSDGSSKSVSVDSTSITMTGGTVWNVFGGNLGQKNANQDGCSSVTRNVNISITGGSVTNLIYGGGDYNTCVKGTVAITLENVELGTNCYVNGGVHGNGNEGTRNIEAGTMTTHAVVNEVIINATNSTAYVLGGGGSGSTKVKEAIVTLNGCTVANLYASGINGEMEKSSLKATDCTVTGELAATNRGFVGTGRVDLNNCYVVNLNTGAAEGCFTSDSGTPDGSGVTGSVVWSLDDETDVVAAKLTPLVVRTGDPSKPTYATTYKNVTIQKEGTPLNVSVSDFTPVTTQGKEVTLKTFTVPENSTLRLKGVKATVAAENTLTNAGTIDMDDDSSLTVASGATLKQAGTVNGTVDKEGTFIECVARVGNNGYETLTEAIDAATDGQTIVLLQNIDELSELTTGTPSGKDISLLSITKSVIIKGNGYDITITMPNEATNRSQAISVGSKTVQGITVTLDDVDLTINGRGTDTDKGDAIDVWATLDITNGSTVTMKGVANGFVMQGGMNAEVNVSDKSSVTADGVSGHFSNGGVWSITNSTVDIANCGTHGLSVEEVTINNSTVTVTGAGYTGLYGNEIELVNGADVTVENCGTSTAFQSNATYKEKGAVQLKAVKDDNGTLTITDSTLTLTGNSNGATTGEQTIYVGNATVDINDGSNVYAQIKSADGATTQYYTVVFKNENGEDQSKIVESTQSGPGTIMLPDLPDQGYNHFVGWTDQAGKHYDGGDTVTITADTTFTAQWTYIPPANPNYRIDIPDFEGGTVTADPAAAKAGATVTLTATPDEGYAVGTITVTDRFGDAVKVTENADGTYTFTMPNGQVTVKATFVETEEPAPAEPFPDVDENDWFYDEVVYVYENGLMNGVENNQFAPNTATNRAMLATILYRLAGEPAVSGDLPFTDVAAGTWYTDAVLWAAQNGIVNGLGENTFAPMNTLTREQLVTMLYRYAEAKGYDVSASADLSGYPDAGQVQDYAQPAMAWAVAENIIQGMEDGTLKPAGNASRAQIATILMRFCEDVAQ